MKVFIELDNIAKSYPTPSEKRAELKSLFLNFSREKERLEVLKSISLKLFSGEVLGLVGLNGAGKSTILKVISGLLLPEKGALKISGKINPVLNIYGSLHSELTLEKNILFYYSILGVEKSKMNSLVEKVLDFAELQEKRHWCNKKLSSGQVSRLSFSMAIHNEADVYLLDECLSVGDYFFKLKCFQRINEMKSQGKSFIAISHSNEDLMAICDRMLWVKEGEIYKEGLPHDIIQGYQTS